MMMIYPIDQHGPNDKYLLFVFHEVGLRLYPIEVDTQCSVSRACVSGNTTSYKISHHENVISGTNGMHNGVQCDGEKVHAMGTTAWKT